MNTSYLHLGFGLGDLTTPSFQRHTYTKQISSTTHNPNITFSSRPAHLPINESSPLSRAHQAGTTCLAIDQTQGRYLLTGGADAAIHLWDLTSHDHLPPTDHAVHTPLASLTRASSSSASISQTHNAQIQPRGISHHTHALTSLSIYPHDPTPQSLLSTSHDTYFNLTRITPSTLTPLFRLSLDFHINTCSPHPHPSYYSALVALATDNPSIRLVDLRTGTATQTLPGHGGPVYTVAWHGRHDREHVLVSGGSDGRVLFHDIRAGRSCFASLDLDDSVGLVDTDAYVTDIYGRVSWTGREQLDFRAKAHEGSVTGLVFAGGSEKLVSVGHDQRIRLWDLASGKNELVHFGARVRNSRVGSLGPVLLPAGVAATVGSVNGDSGGGGGGRGMGRGDRELLFWPNDDGRGEVHVYDLNEGDLLDVWRMRKLKTSMDGNTAGMRSSGDGRLGSGPSRTRAVVMSSATTNPATGAGRINALAWRSPLSEAGVLEMYSVHGDGQVCVWQPHVSESQDEEDDGDMKVELLRSETEEEENRKKRKLDALGGLVEGLGAKKRDGFFGR